MNADRRRIGDRVEVRIDRDRIKGVLLEKLDDDRWRLAPDQEWLGERLIPSTAILRKVPTKVERNHGPTVYYTDRRADGTGAGSLHHRQVQALIAVRAGLGRMRLRRIQASYFCDYYLEPEIDVYGIGYGTASHLQRWGYIEQMTDEGPLSLTAKGNRILDEILALDGTSLPPMVMEAA